MEDLSRSEPSPAVPAAPPGRRAIGPGWFSWLAFAGLCLAVSRIYGPYLPLPGDRLGHDFAYYLPSLLDGKIWFENNGFTQPWFTPSFCAGQPAFPDPQSSWYGVLQLMALAVSPVVAVYGLLMLTVSLAYWGGYLVMRRIFRTGRATAILVGGLLMFNGFLPHRLLIGHVGYHGFALVPWFFLLLAHRAHSSARGMLLAMAGGLLFAYWLHSGFAIVLLIGLLATAMLVLFYGAVGGDLRPVLRRGAVALAVGAALGAAKLCATQAYLSHYPRNAYPLPGARSLLDSFIMAAQALFLPSQWAGYLGRPRLTNVYWALPPHEWAYNFCTFLPLVALGLLVARMRRHDRAPSAARPWRLALALLGSLAVPLALNTFDPVWTSWLKRVPILGSTSVPLRWFATYIPISAVGLGLLLEKTLSGRASGLLAASVLALTVGEAAMEPRQFYAAQDYDARPVLEADRRLRSGQWTPAIDTVASEARLQVGQESLPLRGNDTLVAGVSAVPCYNPVFGYELEQFSVANLHAGAITDARDGYLNLKNPACYVFPAENHCRPGDAFRIEQREEALRFARYRPFPFAISTTQAVAERVSELAFAALLLAAAAVLTHMGWRRWRARRDGRHVGRGER